MALNHQYRLFGLNLSSEIELPELVPSNSGFPDVAIRRGVVEEPACISIADVARFSVIGGVEIIVEAAPGVQERNVRLYLLGSAMGQLLHQRGLLPLHANALEVGGRVVAVLGPSGAGKSTLAAWLMTKGCRLLSDDVCVVRFHEAGPAVYPGVPRLRLWGESLDVLGHPRAGLKRAYAGGDRWDKWDVPIASALPAEDGLGLRALYLLDDGADIQIMPMAGASAVGAVSANTYRGDYLTEPSALQTHWRACVRLAAAVPVFRLQRPRDLTRLDALGETLLAHQRSVEAVRTGAAVR